MCSSSDLCLQLRMSLFFISGKGKGGSKVVIAIVVPIVLVALFAVLLCLVLKWKKNKSGNRVIGNVIVILFVFFV